MQLLLLAGLSLLSALQAQEEDLMISAAPTVQAQEEDLVVSPATKEKLLGKWYINRWAGTIPIPREKRHEPLPPFSFVINYNGKLEFRMHIRKPSGCQLLKLPFTKLFEYGTYVTWWKHRIIILLITSKNYGIAYFDDKINNQEMTMVMLFGRTLDDHPEVLRLFRHVVTFKGLNTTDIINPPHIDSCKLTSNS